MNKATVLGLISELEPVSRIDLANQSGLNKATVSSLVDELISDHYVGEIGLGVSSGGRKPIMLALNADAAHFIGVNVQITHMTTVVANIKGESKYTRQRQLNFPLTEADLLAAIVEEVDGAIEHAPASPHGLLGIGVAVPGMVNYDTGYIHYLPNMGIRDWDVRAALMERFEIPVFIDNDGNCGAWAEYRRLAGTVRNLVYLHVGVGLGAGLVVHGQLYRGADGIAGEYGHTTISAMGLQCACGNYGCWEQYASEQSLLRYLREGGEEHLPPRVDKGFVGDLVRAVEAGNTVYARALHTFAQNLGVGLMNVINAFNPHSITIGGTISHAEKYILPELISMVGRRKTFPERVPHIRFASNDLVLTGAVGIATWETVYRMQQV